MFDGAPVTVVPAAGEVASDAASGAAPVPPTDVEADADAE
jgi:hypothetical protein